MSEAIPPLGTLTDRVVLKRKLTTDEAEGGTATLYSTISTVWARVRQLTTRAAFADDARGQAVTHSVVIRFRSDLSPGDRIVSRGRNFEIASLADINGRRAYLGCQCIERAVTG